MAPLDAVAAELGVHTMAGCDSRSKQGIEKTAAFSAWLGRKPDRVLDFAWTTSWPEILRSTRLLAQCWKAAGYDKLTYSVPMLPKDDGNLAAGAAGAYDDYFRQIAEILIHAGYGDGILRVGWEFNIPNWPWSAYRDPVSWVPYYQRIVRVMRAVPGARFRFDWNPTLEMTEPGRNGRVAPDEFYPGDEYVDIIGLDIYNSWWGRPFASADQKWQTWMDWRYGLAWQRDFAARHGKPISFPEWGTGDRLDGHGGGDDPAFIRHMAAWIAENNVAYHAYWDKQVSNYDAKLSDGRRPEAAAAFLQIYGVRH